MLLKDTYDRMFSLDNYNLTAPDGTPYNFKSFSHGSFYVNAKGYQLYHYHSQNGTVINEIYKGDELIKDDKTFTEWVYFNVVIHINNKLKNCINQAIYKDYLEISGALDENVWSY